MSQEERKSFYGWVIVATAFTVIFLHLSIRGSFAVFLKPMVKSLGWSTAAVALGLSIFMFFYGITAFFAGRMVDKYGPRWVIFIHGCLLGLGMLLSSFARLPWHFYLTYGVMGGIGAGALYVPPTAMVRKWFMKDLGRALGLAVAGAGLGFFIAPIASMYLIQSLSWQFAMKFFGIIIICGIAIATIFMRGNPEEMGLKPYGYEEMLSAQKASGAGVAMSWSLGEAIKTSAFWVIVIMYFCSNLAEYIVFSHAVNYVVTDRGFNLRTATFIYSIIGLCFLFFGPIGGAIADRLGAKLHNEFLGRKIVLTVAYTTVAIASAWLSFVKTPWMFVIYVFLYGIPFGVYIPSVAAYVGTTFGRAAMGTIWGLTTVFGVALGCGLGPYIGGALRDATGNYQAAIWLAFAVYVLAAIMALSVKKPQKATAAEAKADKAAA